jgi:hypothetical protein
MEKELPFEYFREWNDTQPGILSFRVLCEGVMAEYPNLMAVNWVEVAKKMAEDARAQLAINRKRLREILAERAHQQAGQEPHANAQ